MAVRRGHTDNSQPLGDQENARARATGQVRSFERARSSSPSRAEGQERSDQQNTRAATPSRRQSQQAAGVFQRVPLVAIVVAAVVLLGVILFAGRLCSQAASITVSVNGTNYTLRGDKNLEVAIKESGLPVNPGDFISLQGNIIERSAGYPFYATVNGKETVDPQYRLHEGDVITLTDGHDRVEEYDVEESSVPYSWGESYSPGSYDGRGLNTAQLTGVYEINTSDRDAVKNAIMTHGAVDAAFYVADYYDDYYSYTNNSYYYPEFNYMNHAVMLVGWDDNFSSSRFIGGTPEGNGAWLVRNSWGLSDYGFSGYFWISYYDKSLYDTVLAMDAQTSRYDHCYAYDSIPFYTYDEYTSDTGHYSGTQYFYVERNEQIKAVGIQAQDPMMDVEISLLCGNSSSTTTTSIGYPGYYLIPVDKALGVRQGSTVKVTVTFSRDGVIHFPVEESYSYAGSDFEAYCGSGGVTLDDGSGNTINTEADGGIKLFTMDYTPSQDPWDSAGSLYSGSNNVPVSSGQTVYYAFTPQNTGDYELFSMSGKDTYACLYNDNKELLTNNDDGGEGNNFKITYSLIEDTTYYLGIKYDNSSESGDIPVGIAFLPQENLNVVGVSAGGTEYIAFTPSADGNYSFSACSGMDTCGTLYDSNWNQLAWDDDGGYERDFIITCSLEAYSTYYLGVNYYSSSDFGSMAVIMAKSAITGTNLVTVSGGSGAYLAFTPQTTGNYEIYSDSDLDPYVDMYDLGFMTLARDDDGGSDNNFRLVTTLEAGTTYLFALSASTGNRSQARQ